METGTEQDIPDPATLLPDISERLRDFIIKACARNPDDRYQNINEVMDAIKDFSNEVGHTKNKTNPQGRKMRIFYLVYENGNQNKIDLLVDEFNSTIKKMELNLKLGI